MAAEGKGEGNRVTRLYGVAVHPWSPGEGGCSGGSCKASCIGQAKSRHIHHCRGWCPPSSLPTLPHGDDHCRSKTSGAARDTWTSAAPLSSPHLRGKPPSADVSMKRTDSELRQAQHSPSSRWFSLLPGWWYLFLFSCRADRWGQWCLQWDNMVHQQRWADMLLHGQGGLLEGGLQGASLCV